MENKKLLKYLLKDLSELDEMFAEKDKNSFDNIEIEFIQNRISSAVKLVQLFLVKENDGPAENKSGISTEQKSEAKNSDLLKYKSESEVEVKIQEIKQAIKTAGVWIEESVPGDVAHESGQEIKSEEKATETVIVENVQVVETKIENPIIVKANEIEIQKQTVEEAPKQTANLKHDSMQRELQMEDEEPVDIHNKRLGDSFLKEKSVNDIMSDDSSKLEHKLSNRPVSSIQSAIGINDRFQYIRELFEGSTDNFVKTVADLDSLNDIKEAVDYLQTNFKWKKNDTSQKFVNIIKRRFPNE